MGKQRGRDQQFTRCADGQLWGAEEELVSLTPGSTPSVCHPLRSACFTGVIAFIRPNKTQAGHGGQPPSVRAGQSEC